MRPLTLVLSLLLLSACTSGKKRQQEFESIQIGMVKSEVLEVAGPPHWSDRSGELDRWIYYMKPEDKQTERIIYFRRGKVFQKGLRKKPALTAEEMEQVKQPRVIYKASKPSLSKSQLREVLKKEVEQKTPKKKKKTVYEKI